jgi:hypothetical protein
MPLAMGLNILSTHAAGTSAFGNFLGELFEQAALTENLYRGRATFKKLIDKPI